MPLLPRIAFQTAIAASVLLVSACGNNKHREKSTAPPAAPTETAGAKPAQINVFVDMSGGMQGFVHPVAPGATGSGFQQTVTDLLSAVNAQRGQQRTSPAYYFFKESTPADARLLVPSTYQEMTSTVSGGLKNAARGSELPQMLSEALKLQAQKPGTVSILISDFIFAPKLKGETWKIKTFIKDALSEVEASKLGVSVFANTSEYKGNFYPGNRSGKQALNGEKVPYYIWVLGDPALVAQADAGLLRQLAAQPQAHYNVRFRPDYAVLDFYEPMVGQWTADNGTPGTAPVITFRKKPNFREPAEVVLGLNLSKLPPSQTQELSLKTLRLAGESTPATLTKVWSLAQEEAAKSQPAFGRFTHFVQLRFTQAPPAATLALELARPQPAWIAAYSVADDSNIKKAGAKTFFFKEVMQGVEEYFANEPGAQRVFSLPVQVETRD